MPVSANFSDAVALGEKRLFVFYLGIKLTEIFLAREWELPPGAIVLLPWTRR